MVEGIDPNTFGEPALIADVHLRCWVFSHQNGGKANSNPSVGQSVHSGGCFFYDCLSDSQSIKNLGDEVGVSAVESTGVVQAIERHNHPYFIGVQWHPEYMPQSDRQQRLFRCLADSAAEYRR